MRWEEFPSQFEQDIAYNYCVCRPLYRPKTSVLKVIAKWSAFTVVVALLYGLSLYVIQTPWIRGILQRQSSVSDVLSSLSYWWSVIVVELFCWLFGLRWFLIDCIELYQRYATEEVRRRCLLMPTCSEFTILALSKYGLIIGLVLAYIRIFKRCRGNVYRIEYPSLRNNHKKQ